MSEAERLNADCHAALLDRAALQCAMQREGEVWQDMVTERCPHLFAEVPVFITAAQMRQMREAIDAVERVVGSGEWGVGSGEWMQHSAKGVFYGYDFHLNADGAHLIEINSNAGGGFLLALLLDSQSEAMLPGILPVHADASSFDTSGGSAQGTQSVSKHESSPFDTSGRTNVSLNDVFIEMFRNEWRLARGAAPLHSVAIVDEQPEGQYLYPEFLLAQRMFERAGIAAHIVDPAALQARGDGLYLESSGGDQKIDLVYNRLTDFSLQQHPVLRQAYLEGSVVLTPDPAHYARYADKRNLARLTDADSLRALGASEADIATLQAGVPQTRQVEAADHEQWWQERKQWFFKPNSGYGSKGTYRGANLTRRVFDEIMQGGYIAQKLAVPGERMVCVDGAEAQPLKYDVRCYVYDGQVQLVAARLYQGQTTNFRTPGGGFAPVYLVG